MQPLLRSDDVLNKELYYKTGTDSRIGALAISLQQQNQRLRKHSVV